MFDYSQKQKRSIIALLAQMADADNKIAGLESKYIQEVAARMDLSEEDILEALQDAAAHQLEPPVEERDRMSILYYLLFMMRADGSITDKEEEFCYKVGLNLGIQPALTRDLIGVMKTYLNEDVPPEAMLEQIKKYLN